MIYDYDAEKLAKALNKTIDAFVNSYKNCTDPEKIAQWNQIIDRSLDIYNKKEEKMISIEDMTYEQLHQFVKDNDITLFISDIAWATMSVDDKKLLAQDIYTLLNEEE